MKKRFTNKRFVASMAALCLLTPLLASCSDDDAPQQVRAAHVLQFEPEKDVKVAKASSAAPSLGGDPLDSGGNRITQTDPLDSGGDALTHENGLASQQDPLSKSSINNWYWLRGSISGGTITVQVDGVSLGEYSVHMDKEITQMLHPGSNSLTFTPQRDNPQAPVQAHIEVVYSQMTLGQLPPLVYDTRQAIQPSSASIAHAPASVYNPVNKPANGDKGLNASGDSGSLSGPLIPLPVSGQDTPTTLTFIAQ